MDRLQSERQYNFTLDERINKTSNQSAENTSVAVAYPIEMRKKVTAEFDSEIGGASAKVSELCKTADYYYEKGDDAMAQRHYLEALNLIESETAILFHIFKNLGNISVRAGDYDGAEELYNKAYTISPDSDVLLVNYGTLEIQRENYEKSRERFRQAVAINPENDRAWIGLALAHRHFGDHELGWANLERALDINGDNETALHLSIDWAYKDLRVHSTIERIQEFVKRHPERQELTLMEAKLLALSGRGPAAASVVEQLKKSDPHLPGLQELERLIHQLQERNTENRVD